jgi:hypothetical protein
MIVVRPYTALSARGELWTCDARGNGKGMGGQNLTRYLDSMVVSYDWLADVKGSLRVKLRETGIARAIIDCLQPRMILKWRDASGKLFEIDRPLGVFYFLPSDKEVDEQKTVADIEAYDGTWALSHLTADALKVIGTGRDYGLEAFSLLNGRTPMNLNIPHTGEYVVTPRTVRPGNGLSEWANDLMTAANFWDLAARVDGNVTSYKRTVLSGSEPSRIVNSRLGDVVRLPVREMPDRDGWCNQVHLASNNPEAELSMRDGYRVSFVDANSPFSVVNTPYVVSKAIADSRSESFATLRQRAIMILERASGLLTRKNIAVVPNPDFRPREVWQIDVWKRDGSVVASGNYFVEQVHFSLMPGAVAQTVTVSSLAPLGTLVDV